MSRWQRRAQEIRERQAAEKQAQPSQASTTSPAPPPLASFVTPFRLRHPVVFWTPIVLAGAVATAGLVFALKKFDDFSMEYSQGDPHGAIAFADRLILVDTVFTEHTDSKGVRVRDYRTRLTVVDAHGQQQVVKVLDGNGGCAVANADRLWCDTDGIHAIDARTLDDLGSIDDMLSRAHLPRAVVNRRDMGNDGRLWVGIDDGGVVVFDAATLQPTRSASPPAVDNMMARRPDPNLSYPFGSTGSCSGSTLDGERDATVEAMRHLGPPGSKPAAERAGSGGGASPPSVAFSVVPTSITAKHDAITGGGAKPWRVELNAQCESTAVIGGLLVVTTTRSSNRVLAIDPKTGDVVWRYAR
jgi:hypothetical protein